MRFFNPDSYPQVPGPSSLPVARRTLPISSSNITILIAVGATGVTMLVIMIITIIFCCRRKRRERARQLIHTESTLESVLVDISASETPAFNHQFHRSSMDRYIEMESSPSPSMMPNNLHVERGQHVSEATTRRHSTASIHECASPNSVYSMESVARSTESMTLSQRTYILNSLPGQLRASLAPPVPTHSLWTQAQPQDTRKGQPPTLLSTQMHSGMSSSTGMDPPQGSHSVLLHPLQDSSSVSSRTLYVPPVSFTSYPPPRVSYPRPDQKQMTTYASPSSNLYSSPPISDVPPLKISRRNQESSPQTFSPPRKETLRLSYASVAYGRSRASSEHEVLRTKAVRTHIRGPTASITDNSTGENYSMVQTLQSDPISLGLSNRARTLLRRSRSWSSFKNAPERI